MLEVGLGLGKKTTKIMVWVVMITLLKSTSLRLWKDGGRALKGTSVDCWFGMGKRTAVSRVKVSILLITSITPMSSPMQTLWPPEGLVT